MIKLQNGLFWAEVWAKIAFACFMVVMGLIFLKKGVSETEMKSQRYFKIGLAMFALMTTLTRAFFLVTDFQVEDSEIYNLFWKLAVLSSFVAMIFIIIVIETYLVKTKYIFTAIGILGMVLISVVEIPLARQLNIPLYLILGGEVFILYLYVALKTSGTLRKRALLMILSLLIFTAGLIADAESVIIPLFGFDLGLVGVILMWIGLGSYLMLNYSAELE